MTTTVNQELNPPCRNVGEEDQASNSAEDHAVSASSEDVGSLLVPGLAGIAYWFVLFAVLFPIMFLLGTLLG